MRPCFQEAALFIAPRLLDWLPVCLSLPARNSIAKNL